MRKLLLATSALVIGGQISAASATPPVYTWTGCYIGGHIGAGWDRTRFSDPGNDNGAAQILQNIAPIGSSIGVDGGSGALGGVQAGCNYQFMNHWVTGFGGDFSWANIRGQGTDPFFDGKNGGAISLFARTDRFATATGRFGYAWDRFLVYGQGGVAWANDSYSVQNLVFLNGNICGLNLPCNPDGSTTRTGWTLGGGVEWAFGNNWSAKVEYSHLDFGSKGVLFTDPNARRVAAVLNIKQSTDAVKFGINYRFWSPYPVAPH